MSEEQKKTEEEFIPKPEGYTFIVCPLHQVFYLFVVAMVLPFCFIRYLNNEWMIVVIWIVGFVVFSVLAHKLAEAKVNIKFTDLGLEQRKLSGSKLVPEYRFIRWVDIDKCYNYGNTFRIVIKGGPDFPISTPVFSLFEKQKSNRDNFYAFENELYKMVGNKRLKFVLVNNTQLN